jgi:toxin ParE1/3/4
MRWRVVFLEQAERDLIELKHYILHNFSQKIWQQCYTNLKQSVKTIQLFPEGGSIPPEIEALNLAQYRQVISGMNRIVYEIREHIIYIHIICDRRKDLNSLLFRRLLST